MSSASDFRTNAPQPHKTISCQQLLQDNVSHSGWLRRKSKLHASFKFAVKVIPWLNKYAALSKGCMYIYDSDTAKKPSGAFSLYGYNNVLRAGDILQQDAPWAFKIVTVDTNDTDKMRYFSASSERELKIWMGEIKKQMMFANGKGARISKKSHSIDNENASFLAIEEAVYDTTSNLSIGGTDDLEELDDDDYNQIEEWDEQGEPGPVINDRRESRPLPALPPTKSPNTGPNHLFNNSLSTQSPPVRPERQKNRDPVNTPPNRPPPDLSSMLSPCPESPNRVAVFPPGFLQTAALHSPQSGDDSLDRGPPPPLDRRKPPLPPSQPPEDDHFDDVEPQREWNQKKMPPEKSPKPPGFVASQSNTTDNNDAIAGTVNALKAMFNDKPVVASKPGAKKVLPNIPAGNPHQSLQDQRKALKPTPTPKSRSIPGVVEDRPAQPLPSIRQGPEGTDDPEEELLRGIIWEGKDKDAANRTLNERMEEGVFLIRSSDTNEQVLVVYAEGGARKYKIVRNDGKIYITSDKQFYSMQEMLDFYYEENLPKRVTCLTKPYTKY